jgi:hypothetical protein
MALPKLNEHPKYTMKIPSTGVEVRFRPFLVKEEKVMLIALESEDQKQQLMSIVDTLKSCVDTDIDYDKLTTFDVEFMFNQLRGKSVGETAKIMLKCKKEGCEVDNEVVINVDALTIDMPDLESIIKLDENTIVEMTYPSYKDVMSTQEDGVSESKQMFNILRHCLVAVIVGEERIDLKNETQQEIQEFIESMSSEQFTKVREYLETMPTLTHEIDFNCKICDTNHKETVTGIQNFF